jgi:hypothetical protein
VSEEPTLICPLCGGDLLDCGEDHDDDQEEDDDETG